MVKTGKEKVIRNTSPNESGSVSGSALLDRFIVCLGKSTKWVSLMNLFLVHVLRTPFNLVPFYVGYIEVVEDKVIYWYVFLGCQENLFFFIVATELKHKHSFDV